MTANRQSEILVELFTAALDVPACERHPSPSSSLAPHPIDDEEVLVAWSLDELRPERHQDLLDHLAACPACRREITAMVRLGILELPTSDEPVSAQPDLEFPENSVKQTSAVSPESERMVDSSSGIWRRRTVAILVAALAASLLLMFGRGAFDEGSPDGAALIAMAQRDLRGGRADRAFTRLEGLLSRGEHLTAEHQRDAAALLEESGYEMARGDLEQGDFNRVTDIDRRVAKHGGGSGRMTNLRIQAERGETVERSLAARISLTRHYDYELDGRQVVKSLSIRPVTDTDRRIEADMQAAIAAYPDQIELRLNFGQLLLEQRQFQRAEVEFAAAVALAPQNHLAQTGLGLAILEQSENNDDHRVASRALTHFQAAAQLAPNDPIIQQNLLVCQNRVGMNGGR